MNVDKCPLFMGKLATEPARVRFFKSFFCENGKSSHEKCKRYQVQNITGSCPPDILPNSTLSVEEITKQNIF